jgi:hypothetical protein
MEEIVEAVTFTINDTVTISMSATFDDAVRFAKKLHCHCVTVKGFYTGNKVTIRN